MSEYKGLFTYDIDNHRYVPVEQADGIINDMDYHPEPEKEPKVAYFIDAQGDVCEFPDTDADDWTKEEQIGNKFKTEEETEKAVEKLKALKRLKDRGVVLHSFEGAESCENHYRITFSVRCDRYWSDRSHSVDSDLNLLFGGGE